MGGRRNEVHGGTGGAARQLAPCRPCTATRSIPSASATPPTPPINPQSTHPGTNCSGAASQEEAATPLRSTPTWLAAVHSTRSTIISRSSSGICRGGVGVRVDG